MTSAVRNLSRGAGVRWSRKPATFTFAAAILAAAIFGSMYWQQWPFARFSSGDRYVAGLLLVWFVLVHAAAWMATGVRRRRSFARDGLALAVTVILLLSFHFFRIREALNGVPPTYLGDLASGTSIFASPARWVESLLRRSASEGGSLYSSHLFRQMEFAAAAIFPLAYWALFACLRLLLGGLKIGSDDPMPPPMLDDGAARFTLGTAAVLSLVAVLAQHWYNTTPPGSDWREFATATPLWLLLTALVHFAYMVLIRCEAHHTEQGISANSRPSPKTVRPVYDAIVAEPLLAAYRRALWRTPINDTRGLAAHSADLDKDIAALGRGEALLREGPADSMMYRLLSEAVFQSQDRGELAIIVCPNKSGMHVQNQLMSNVRTVYPKEARRYLLLADDNTPIGDKFDGSEFYDFIIAEEGQFAELFGMGAASLKNVLHRVGLFIFIDFHLVDASLCHLALKRFERADYPNAVAMFFQSLGREGLMTQVNAIAGHLGSKARGVHIAELKRAPVPSGWVLWKSCDELRKALLARAGLAGRRYIYQTAPYLALLPERDGGGDNVRDFPRAVLARAGMQADFADLLHELGTDGSLTRKQTEALTQCRDRTTRHFAPLVEPRILIVMDNGSLADALQTSPSFWDQAPDYMTHVVATGYLGREYLWERSAEAANDKHWDSEKLKLLRPMAQSPGIGMPEIGQLIVDRLQNRMDPLRETEAEQYLKLVTGSIEKYLDISVSRAGIERLMKLLVPEFNDRILAEFERGSQSEKFYIEATHAKPMRLSTVRPVRLTGQGDSVVGHAAIHDEGLLFHHHGFIRTDKGYARIEQIRLDWLDMTAALVGRNEIPSPEPVYRYPRHYGLVLGTQADPSSRFVAEQFVRKAANNTQVNLALLQATVSRESTGSIELSSDTEPVPLAFSALDPIAFVSPVRVVRTFRNMLLVNLPLGGGGTEEQDRIVVRTLAATLQTVVALAFPVLATRIAVIPLHEESETFTAALRDESSALRSLFPSGEFVHGNFEGVLQRIGSKGLESNHLDDRLRAASIFPHTIAIIEDGEHDLGVCRSLLGQWSALMARWEDFLRWSAANPGWNVEGRIDPAAALACGIFRTGEPL